MATDYHDTEAGVVATSYDRFSFGGDGLAEFIERLGLERSDACACVYAELEDIARDYLRGLAQKEDSPGRPENNEALRKLAAEAKEFAWKLRALDHELLFEVMLRFEPSAGSAKEPESSDDLGEEGTAPSDDPTGGPSLRQTRIVALAEELEALARAVRGAMRMAGPRSGPEPNYDLALALHRLIEIYERVTGERATHTAGTDGIYDGKPRSRAGQFLMNFFGQVDPRVRKETISTTLASFIRKRNEPKESNRQVGRSTPAGTFR